MGQTSGFYGRSIWQLVGFVLTRCCCCAYVHMFPVFHNKHENVIYLFSKTLISSDAIIMSIVGFHDAHMIYAIWWEKYCAITLEYLWYNNFAFVFQKFGVDSRGEECYGEVTWLLDRNRLVHGNIKTDLCKIEFMNIKLLSREQLADETADIVSKKFNITYS